MSRKEAGKAIAVTIEQFESEQRRRGGGPDFDRPNWLRRAARAELETRMDAHSGATIELSNLFNHRAEARKLQDLFDRVVNGTGNDANKAAVFVLAHYKLRLV
jgi:hypothetical protein